MSTSTTTDIRQQLLLGELLARLVRGPMTPGQTDEWVDARDGARAVLDDALWRGSVERTRGGGTRLHPGRRDRALSAMVRDLGLAPDL